MARSRFHEGSGPSQRQLRVGELLRRRLAEVLSQGEIHSPELNAFSITVGEVRTSPDLKVATAFVMPLGGRDRDEALDALKANRSEIRRAVSRGLNLKFAPEIRFVLDESYDRMDETRALLAREDVRRDLDAE